MVDIAAAAENYAEYSEPALASQSWMEAKVFTTQSREDCTPSCWVISTSSTMVRTEESVTSAILIDPFYSQLYL